LHRVVLMNVAEWHDELSQLTVLRQYSAMFANYTHYTYTNAGLYWSSKDTARSAVTGGRVSADMHTHHYYLLTYLLHDTECQGEMWQCEGHTEAPPPAM